MNLRWHDSHRFNIWLMMGAAFAIAIAITAIHSPFYTTVRHADHYSVTTGTDGPGTTAAPYSGDNQNIDVVPNTGAGANNIVMPGAYGGTFENYFSNGNNFAYNLVAPTGSTVNSASSLPIAATDAGASCNADNNMNWVCVIGAPNDSYNYTTNTWTPLALFAFYTGLVLFLIFLILAMHAYFGRSHFHSQWWVVALTLCFMSVACLDYHASWHSGTTRGVATTAMVITNIVCGVFFLNWLRLFLARELFRPDHHMLSPLEFFRLPNRALREALFQLQAHVQNPQATAEQWRHFDQVLFPHYVMTSFAFNHMKRQVLYPVLTAWFGPNVWTPLDANAAALDREISNLHERMQAVQRMEINSQARASAELAIRKDFATYVSGVTANMDEEDSHIYPLARRYIGAKEANLMIARCWTSINPSQWSTILPFIVEFLHSDRYRVRWIDCLVHASPEHVQLIGKFLYEQCDPFLYDRLIVDIPEMRPRLTSGYSRVW